MYDQTGQAYDYLFLEVNQVFDRQTGLGDVVGKTMRELAPGYEAHFYRTYDQVVQTGEPAQFTDRAEALDRWYEVYAFRIGDKQQAEVGVLFKDVSDRKRVNDALIESENRFRTLANNVSQLLWMTDAKGQIQWCNQRWFDYTGAKDTDDQSEVWSRILHPRHAGRVKAKFARHVAEAAAWSDTFPLQDRQGRYRWFLSRAVPVYDQAGDVSGWFGSNTDVEDLRQAVQRKNELENTALALQAQRAELLALNEIKDEFISLASHQLRTPASAVKQYLGMALDGYAGDLSPDLLNLLSRANQSNERQIIIINDLLRVAQVDAGKVTLTRQPVDLGALLQSVIDEQTSTFASRQQTVGFRRSARPVIAEVDADRFRMVLENLIDNASKYTEPGKQISASLRRGKNQLLIAIKDQGVGIEPADQAKLFQKFSRLDNPLSVAVGGSGIGLYWAKKIIDLHNGTISVESAPGHGSTFTITLPA